MDATANSLAAMPPHVASAMIVGLWIAGAAVVVGLAAKALQVWKQLIQDRYVTMQTCQLIHSNTEQRLQSLERDIRDMKSSMQSVSSEVGTVHTSIEIYAQQLIRIETKLDRLLGKSGNLNGGASDG